ncbi:MAG: DNA-binding protein, partial [Flavobacterium psychrophilum]
MRDLTTSAIDRQNILNNLDAVTNIQQYLGVSGMLFQGEFRFTKEQVADFYKVDPSTIDSYLSQYEKELKHNGYELFKGSTLKSFKEQFGGVINIQAKTTQLGIFNFRAFLNLGMLLGESE